MTSMSNSVLSVLGLIAALGMAACDDTGSGSSSTSSTEGATTGEATEGEAAEGTTTTE